MYKIITSLFLQKSLGAYRNDQVYSNTRVPTQVNTSQHESTRINTINTSPTRVNTNQHESNTSQHESDTSQHESTRV